MNPPLDKLPVYILAGGRSLRFGADKARALIGGVPLACRVAEALKSMSSSQTVVSAEAGAYEDLGLTTIADTRPGMGPIGALEAALADRLARFSEGWLLLSACDLAEPDAALAQGLIGHIREGTQVVAYRTDRWEPLFALYHSSIRGLVSQHLDDGQRAMWRMIESARHMAVPLPAGVTGISQLNTVEALRRYEADRD